MQETTMPRKAKSLKARAEAIFELLEKEEKFIFKSEFEKVGIGTHSIGNWLELIQYIQNQPKIVVKTLDRFTMVGLELFPEDEEK